MDDAAYAIDALAMGRPVVAGHSWGATIALELAARHPARVSALAFVDGPAWPLSETLSWDAFAARSQPPLPRYQDFDHAVASARASFGPAWSEDLIPFVRAGLVSDGGQLVLPLTFDARARILRGLFEARQDRAWRSLAVPALAVFARAKSDVMLAATRRAAERIASVAPGVAIKWYDTPHDIPLYAPDAIARDIDAL